MIDFIDQLRRGHVNRDFTLFLDNCSIHKGVDVKAHIKKHKIKVIYNIQYQPEFNGIEVAWADMKLKFRQILTQFKIDNEKFDI